VALFFVSFLSLILFASNSEVGAVSYGVNCNAEVIFIGARGSGQSTSSYNGLGPEVGKVWEKFRADAERDGKGALVNIRPVKVLYPATSAVDAVLESITGSLDYYISITLGQAELMTYVQQAGNCGNPPSLVLVGYSQGAEVIKNAFNSLEYQGDIDLILLIADPSYSKNDGTIKIGDSHQNASCSSILDLTSDVTDHTLQCVDGAGIRGETNLVRRSTFYNPGPIIYSLCFEGDLVCDYPLATRNPLIELLAVPSPEDILKTFVGFITHTKAYKHDYVANHIGQSLWNLTRMIAWYDYPADDIDVIQNPPIPPESLGSGNNSQSSGAISGADELIFYRNSDGRRIFNEINVDGGQNQLADGSWSTFWDSIVPIELDGDAKSELLFYNIDDPDRMNSAKVYNIVGNTLEGPIATHNWVNGWSHIVPLQLDSDSREELLLYSANSGKYHFLDLNSDGSIKKTIRSGTWSTGWETIKALEFDGSTRSELIFYKEGSSRGKMRLYDLSSTASISRKADSNWSNGWTSIEPIDLTGDGTDELVVYSKTSGKRYIFDVNTTGGRTTLSSGTWRTGWDMIIPIETGDDSKAELLFYDKDYSATKGKGSIYDMTSTNIGTKKQTFNWSRGWDIIIPTQIN